MRGHCVVTSGQGCEIVMFPFVKDIPIAGLLRDVALDSELSCSWLIVLFAKISAKFYSWTDPSKDPETM